MNKVIPLVQGSIDNLGQLGSLVNAPIKSSGILNKLYFDWSFNNDELMVNILNRSSEINKQPIYITVRDVEDLNGNPMTSPVSWTAFVDKNSLKWSEKQNGETYQRAAVTINAFIGDKLVGKAEPLHMSNGEALYFLTIQSANAGILRFETEEGIVLSIDPASLQGQDGTKLPYIPDSHYGSLQSPVRFVPSATLNEDEGGYTYKIIEDDHVIIIRNGARYDVTGKKLNK